MKRLSVLAMLLVTTTMNAGVMQYSSHQLERARKLNFISSDTLLVKVPKNSKFGQQTYLGDWQPFFEAKDGTWAYLRLHYIPDVMSASEILKDLSSESEVMEAYFAPLAKNADLDSGSVHKDLAPLDFGRHYVATPDFEHLQNYLQAPPEGVGAMAAWEIPGGTGRNVKVIDIETCFEERHEDFETAFWVGGNPNCDSTNHGTAVWGQIAARRDGKGVTGIAHESAFGIYGFIEGNLAEVDDQYIAGINRGIQGAMQVLEAGDVLVIEQQMAGPELDKWTAVEYWPHIFDQLKAATDKGIICVQAAGNGSSDFDHPSYRGAFDLKKRNSGCIIVGAVDAQEKERLSFSNFGSRVDASGYGRGVVTTGYGHLFNQGPTRMYTNSFSGTSSATPIVAGAVAVVSSIAKEQGRVLKPEEVRRALRATGIKQGKMTSATRVGNFPVIEELLKKLKL